MVAIANYGQLREALSEHVGHRNISTVLPRLVQMAESYLNRELRTRFQIATVTLAPGITSASMPDDFLEVVDDLSGLSNTNVGDRSFRYFAALPTLTTSAATTNWLLARYPDAYLYAVGVEAAKYLKDADLLTMSKALLDDSLNSIRIEDNRYRWANTTVRIRGITP